ncbi:TraR/DksA C4-type zinc finger protein [Pelosinus sp. sgz500959]|uniref:TraR/DksA C4-type zinc finger protein n=1 Tax=Pelosinus sp. sgz500959 TaxID=3242472 RepID=UPI00366B415A
MKDKQLNYFRQKLQQEKNNLIKQMTSLEETGLGSALGDSISELSLYDNHPADIGDELFERSKDVALRDNAHVLLERVEHALQKIDDGTYGRCDKCSRQIPIERIEALPWASECIQCQRDDDSSDDARRPLEESILKPPFQRTFLDHSADQFVGFDGEDALQAVMRYGSSDSPQDIPGSHDYKDLFPNSDEYEGIVDPADGIPDDFSGYTVKENLAYTKPELRRKS